MVALGKSKFDHEEGAEYFSKHKSAEKCYACHGKPHCTVTLITFGGCPAVTVTEMGKAKHPTEVERTENHWWRNYCQGGIGALVGVTVKAQTAYCVGKDQARAIVTVNFSGVQDAAQGREVGISASFNTGNPPKFG